MSSGSATERCNRAMLSALSGLGPQRRQTCPAGCLYQPMKDRDAFAKPMECLLTDGIVLGVAGLYIRLGQPIEPGAVATGVAGPGLRQCPVLFLRKRAQE